MALNETTSEIEASLLSLESEISKLKLQLLRQELNSKLQSFKIHFENKRLHSLLKNQTNSTQLHLVASTKKPVNLKALSSALYIKVFDCLELWQLIFILLIVWIVLIMAINCIRSRIALRRRTRKAELLEEALDQSTKPTSPRFFEISIINEDLKILDATNSSSELNDSGNSFSSLSNNQSTHQLLDSSSQSEKILEADREKTPEASVNSKSFPFQFKLLPGGDSKGKKCRRSLTTYSKPQRNGEKLVLGFEALESSLRRSQPNLVFY